MTETFKMIRDANGNTRWYRVISQDYAAALYSGQAAFGCSRVVEVRKQIALSLRGVWCMKMHGAHHVHGGECGAKEIQCLKCGLEFAIYPQL